MPVNKIGDPIKVLIMNWEEGHLYVAYISKHNLSLSLVMKLLRCQPSLAEGGKAGGLMQTCVPTAYSSPCKPPGGLGGLYNIVYYCTGGLVGATPFGQICGGGAEAVAPAVEEVEVVCSRLYCQ